jgi:undecaprenyl diphosphate synthase
VAIIMDGNGRWAVRQGLHRRQGHRHGFGRLPDIIAAGAGLGLSWLSFYCWSTENWNRPVAEQYCVLGLIRRFVREQLPTWQSAGIRFAWAGRRERIGPHLRAELSRAEEATAGNDGLTVCLCVDYGGRVELTNAVREIARESAAGRLDPEISLDEHIQAHLYRPDMPDVDLLIRTSGEQRTSNFLTWQTTYAEMLFPPVLWPDFTPQDLSEAIHTYAERDRRFGALPPIRSTPA